MKEKLISIIEKKIIQPKLTTEIMVNEIIILFNAGVIKKAKECSGASDIKGFKAVSSLMIDLS